MAARHPDLSHAEWRKSTYSSSTGQNCVEVATNLPASSLFGTPSTEHYHELHHLLRLWRLRAAAYSDPGYESRLQAVQKAVHTGRHEGTPTEEIVPDWAERVAAAQRPPAE